MYVDTCALDVTIMPSSHIPATTLYIIYIYIYILIIIGYRNIIVG